MFIEQREIQFEYELNKLDNESLPEAFGLPGQCELGIPARDHNEGNC